MAPKPTADTSPFRQTRRRIALEPSLMGEIPAFLCGTPLRRVKPPDSARFDEPRRLVALEQVEQEPQAPVLLARQPLAAPERGLSLLARPRQQAAVDVEPGEAEA